MFERDRFGAALWWDILWCIAVARVKTCCLWPEALIGGLVRGVLRLSTVHCELRLLSSNIGGWVYV